jgi:hypothetical protein
MEDGKMKHMQINWPIIELGQAFHIYRSVVKGYNSFLYVILLA